MAKLTYTTRRFGKYQDIEFSRGIPSRVRTELLALGYHYSSHIRSWRGTGHFDEAIQVAESAVKASIDREIGTTLCDKCRNAGHGSLSPCPWEREFKPVVGWTAEKTTVEQSFRVTACPLYKAESTDPAERARYSLAAWQKLLEA